MSLIKLSLIMELEEFRLLKAKAACKLEQITSDVVGPMKEAPMIIEKESDRDFLRALLKSPQFGLPGYMADPIVQRRVGRAVAEASTQPVCTEYLIQHGRGEQTR
jgi:hypothetical protein